MAYPNVISAYCMDRIPHASVLILICLWLTGCATVSFYSQSVRGQLSLLARREDIQDVLKDESLDPKLREKLELAVDIRRYASTALALPDNDSYRSYVGLDRANLLWSVFAAPELSLEPRIWCFPFAGCVPYRGYFSKRDAHAFADGLRKRGDDVYVGGVAAYSTLGWFADPVLSTMLRYGKANLASLIFHELAHQKVYFPGDAQFNEAFAEAVGETGATRWLQSRGDHETELRYDMELRHKTEFIDWLGGARARLGAVYAGTESDAEKRARKQAIIAGLSAEYEALKLSWGGYAGFDSWFEEPVNNARLAALGIYRDDAEAFKRLLADCGGDYPRFYAAVAGLKDLQPAMRKQRLQELRCGTGAAATLPQATPPG